TPDNKKLLAELAEVIIPKTDTPGAKEAGVAAFIERMMRDCYSPFHQANFLKGLATANAEAKKLKAPNFVMAKKAQKIEVMKTLEAMAVAEAKKAENEAKQVDSESGLVKENQKKKGEVEKAVPFFNILRELTVFGYFWSEKGANTLQFIPIPGRFEGCMKIAPGTKPYAH
ncbi:MAG: gluconate 2-dehydrogenase subunit 3 family protein, partial [Leadbetterella sp.]